MSGTMVTRPLFQEDAYLQDCEARVVAVNARGGILLDQTVFYPTGGGQPGDSGVIAWGETGGGNQVRIATTLKGEAPGEIVHVPADGQPLPSAGELVKATIDWPLRHRRMRIHTGLHLLSAVLAYPVTGGAIGDGRGRLDFDIPEGGLDKAEIAAALNRIVEADYPVTQRWISDDELAARPELVKTMSVKPPSGAGRVRLIEVGGPEDARPGDLQPCDLQPCGGTHVRRTGEIGPLIVAKIEKKGRQNRRVVIMLEGG